MKLPIRFLSRCRTLPAAVFLTGVLLAQPAAAQSGSEDKVYTYVEQMPQLPGGGGNAAIVAAIQERLVYPEQALRKK